MLFRQHGNLCQTETDVSLLLDITWKHKDISRIITILS